MLYGSIVASCGVEAFSLDALTGLTRDGIEARMAEYRNMLKVS